MRIAFGAALVIVAGVAAACGSSSGDELFSDGGSAGTTGSSSGGSGASATGGFFGSGGFGATGGASVGGTFGNGGVDGFGGGIDGSLEDGTAGFGGADPDGSGGSFGTDGVGGGSGGFGGSGPEDAGRNDGVRCGNLSCVAGQQCCVSSNRQTCGAMSSQCTCGFGCTAAAVTCDSPSDCQNGQVCCYNVVVSPISAYVSSVRCQATCNTPLSQYVLCEQGGPNVCTGNTSCSQALLMPSGYFACQ
jgi:hypothetical protein